MYQCVNQDRKKNPKEITNLFSLITFFFTRDIFRIGLKRDLVQDDIYKVLNVCESEKLGNLLEDEWNKQCENGRPSFFKLLAKSFGLEYIYIGLNQLLYSAIAVVIEPYLVGKLVAFFKLDQTNITLKEAYIYGGVLVLSLTIKEVYMHNCFLYLFQLAIKVRVGLCSLVYRKSLKLSYDSLIKLSSGRIITVISKDVYTLDGAIFYGNEIWIGFIQVTALTYIIYQSVGYAAFSGVGFMLLIIPIQVCISKYVAKLRKKSLRKSDERLRLIQEILTTIRIIKMYTWEKFYMKRTNEERKAEVKKLRSILYIRHVILSIGQFSWRVSFYLLFISYLYLEEEISAEKIFVVLSCYATLRHYMTIGIPVGITQIVEAVAVADRITELLTEPSLNTTRRDIAENPIIKMDGVVAALNPNQNIFEKLTLTVTSGLVALTGPLGAGKSSLIKTILQDLQIVSGNVHISGNISYASQEPWLFPASLKQNILFGEEYDMAKYNKVINLCALRSDIERMEDGDETIIIDKGLNLSRGQQARVNLARAIYKEADIYLLDDSLSSLDGNVSSHIFNNCIKNYLTNKICVFVTHQRQYLKEANRIIYVTNGKILIEGTYDEILTSSYGEELLKNQIDFDNETQEVVADMDNSEDVTETDKLLEKKTVYRENQKLGRVDFEMYKTYFKSGNNGCLLFFIAIIFVIAQGSASYFDYFITRWINAAESNTYNVTSSTEPTTGLSFSTIYSVLIFIVVVSDLTRAVSFFYFATTASILLHNRIFNRVMRATMEFFDLNLTGNILNRFAKDIGVIDEQLPGILFSVLKIIFVTLGSISLIVNAHYVFIFYSLIFVVVLYVMRNYYMPASRSLKRLDGSTRAPIVGHINASLEGLTTIRAYDSQTILIKQFDQHQNLHTSATYMLMSISRAFGFYIDMWCKLYVFAIVFTFITIPLDSTSGNVGIAITEAIGLTGLIQYGLRMSADLENAMTSIERVEDYSKINTERAEGIHLKIPEGSVEFSKVNLKYSTNSDHILKDVDFTIRSKEKVGIIGRTGAGKSSVISTLFRLYDIDGQIKIDDVDIKTMKLNSLRTQLSIIPQNPVLFTGTLRSNLDPYRRHTDNVLWKALEEVYIKDIVKDLNDEIAEGGSNFSIGQRQLICLARAVLKNNKILVLDEATANVDPNTETLIQKTIKEKFADCTVFTIAHRLETIMNSDKILVLDKGKLIEFDSPSSLLNDEYSRFYLMSKQAGLIN